MDATRETAAVLLPGDDGYDRSRTIWNSMIDRHPARIHRCATDADVVAAVRAAGELNLDLGVRCGGHSAIGHAIPDAGLLVDLTPMNRVTVDPVRRTARVQGGAMLADLDVAAQQYGLATTAGNVSHTGVGGLTLGGGMGWLARRFGLACDNVLGFTVVTADGRVVRATRDEHPDLYWALKGGGGNFGIVTEFEFALHQIGNAAAVVELDFAPDEARSAMRSWRDLAPTTPREATLAADLVGGVLSLGYVWVGDPSGQEELLASIRRIGRPVAERVTTTTYLALQSRNDVPAGYGKRRYGNGHYFTELTDDAIDVFLDPPQGPLSPGIGLQAYGGAIRDVADDDSAFSHRDAVFEFGIGAAWTDAAEDAERVTIARTFAARLSPFASGAYVNAMEGASAISSAYSPAKLARLSAIKAEWDPHNLFRGNHNIVPATAVD